MYSHIKEHVGLEYCAQMPIYLEWYASKTLEWSANINYSISKQLYFYKRRKYSLFNLHIVAWYFLPLKRISKIWAILDTKFSSELKNKQDMCTSMHIVHIFFGFVLVYGTYLMYTKVWLFVVYTSVGIDGGVSQGSLLRPVIFNQRQTVRFLTC